MAARIRATKTRKNAAPKAGKRGARAPKAQGAARATRDTGPVLVVHHAPPLPFPEPDPRLPALPLTDRFAMLARAAADLDLSDFDRLSMLAAEYSTYYRTDAEAPDAGDALTLGRIVKAMCFALATDDREWLEEQAKRAKAYLDRNEGREAAGPLWAVGGDIADTRPDVAQRLRYVMLERLEAGASVDDATPLADLLMSFLFSNCRQSSMPVVVDIPNAPTVDAIHEARRAALAGEPRSKGPRSAEAWEKRMREHAAFVDSVRRRDPWAFWPEDMRPRCKQVRRRMLHVLNNREPETPLAAVAEELVRAGLRGLGYPEKKVRSLFASRITN